MTFRRSFIVTLLFALIIATAYLAGYLTRDRQLGRSSLPILHQAYDILSQHGYLPTPASPALEYGMIRGMLEAYQDPYSRFAEPPQAEIQSNNLAGKFGGIGAELSRDAGGYPTLLPYPQSPAAEAGIQEGDRILQIDDLLIQPTTAEDTVLAAIRGPVGKTVRLILGRPPEYTPFEVDIRRVEFPLPSVTSYLEPTELRLGVIQINLIANTTPDEIQKAIKNLQDRGAQAYVLDLRDNYGGLLQAGIECSRLFLKEGIILREQYRGQDEKTYTVDQPGPLVDIPLVILVNQNTASAAEIIAGALQVNERAKLIGLPTYGKDTIQLVFELQDQSSLHITAARWWIPQLDLPKPGVGLKPDIEISKVSEEKDAYLLAATQFFFPIKTP